ncbi:MAG TPA: hypothetical protein PLD88_10340, partial [Candidatus Berkiella sp.]|nr:hypothetical protein [Candidatus Berkiella sp.]
MLKFRSLGDGDCLYNTEAVWLVSSFMQGKLDPLLKSKTRVNELHKLLKAFEANELTEVAEKPSEKAVRDG